MDEPSFPRGGSVSTSPGGKKRHRHAEEKDLFQTGDTPAKKTKKAKKTSKVQRAEKKVEKAKQKKKAARLEGHLVLNSSINTPATLNAGIIVPGLLVLGAVKEVQDYCLIISLPNGVEGRVAIPHICDAYTRQLQQLTEDNDQQMAEEVASLDELFRPGMTVCCKVLSTSDNVRKKRLPLTLNPREVNQTLTSSHLKGGVVLSGCVSSCEDHGYVMDLGVPGINAFLKKKAAAEFIEEQNEGRPLSVGSYLRCMILDDDRMDIMTGESRTVGVVVNPRKVHRSQVSPELKLSLQTLMPGMPVKVTVSKVTDDGVLVKFLTYSGSVHYSHLQEPARNYNKGQELNTTILFINPTSKAVSLSTLTHLVTPDLAPRRLFADIERGSILEAEVTRADKQRGVYLKLDDHHQALAYKTELSDKPVSDVQSKFPVGGQQRCRVLGFDYADNVVVVTMKTSTLEQQFMQYSDIKPGDTIEGTVRGLHKRGLSVDVTAKLNGFVPHIHMADVILHHPEKKFSKGDKIKCKVLVIEPSERKLTLTCKKSLLRSKNPTLTSYQQASPGMVVDGVITKIDKKGCLVVFYNNVKGWVPARELSTEKIQFPEKVFFVGQMAKCRILSVSPETGRMSLSFRDVGKAAAGSKMAARPADFEIGKVVSCRVVKIGDMGLDVVLLPSELPAFLPTMQLSDFINLRPLLKSLYQPGDVIEEAMYLEAGSVITLTMKHSLVQASQEGQLVKDFSSLKLGDIYPGTITKHMDYGMFVDLTHKIVGLAPNKFLYDRKLPQGRCLYRVGQSVVAKVTEVDTERRRLLLSLRMVDCYHGNTKYGLDILEAYLSEHSRIMESLLNREVLNLALRDLKLGSVVKATITEVTDQGALCQFEGGVSGFAVHEHLRGVVVTKGQVLDAVVLYVEPSDGSVEVSLSADLVSAVKGRSRNKYSQVERGQTLKSETVMVRDNFILVHLKQHGRGQMAYLPAKRLFNDVLEKHQFIVGQENPVVIKRVSGDVILASLKLHEDSNKENAEEVMEKAKLGTITTATIRHVGDKYLYVNVGDATGRIHISEMVDIVSDGVNPLSQHSVEEKVRVKIIAVKHVKKNQELPANVENCRTYYDCTMKPSKLMRAGFRKSDNPQKKTYKKNQAVNVFVDHFDSPCLHVVVSDSMRGKVYLTNLSEDLAVLQEPERHFVPGQAYLAHVLAIKDNSKSLELTLTKLTHDMSEGQMVTGVCSQSSRPDFLIVNLSGGYRGSVALTDLSDKYRHLPLEKFSRNELVRCCILDSTEKTRCALSLRRSRTDPDHGTSIRDPELTWSRLRSGQVSRGYITGSSKDNGVWVSLARDICCRVNYDHLSKHYIQDIEGVFYVGKVVTVAILSVDESSHRCELSLLENHTGVPEDIPADVALTTRTPDAPKKKAKQKTHDDASETKEVLAKEEKKKKKKKDKKKRKRDAEAASAASKKPRLKEEDHDSGLDSDEAEVTFPEVKVQTSMAGQTMPHLTLSAGFSWDANLPVPAAANKKDSDTEDDSEEEEETGKAKKPKSRAEKIREKKEEEKRVFQREHELLDQQRSPETSEDFDRLVLQSPDSSIVWLRYMAHHLETAEIEKARAVAERALKTISFREEQEKLNIWVAYLNLENMYGTHESLNEVFKEALQRNEPIKVYQQLITIYANSGKIESAEQLYDQMVRRFSLNKDVWTSYGLFLFKNAKAEMARKVMQRSLKSLDKRDHLEVIAKFAQMEFKHGEPERGKTMFENILSNYAKRNDLWLVYIDMVTHLGEYDTARKLFERATGISFSAKKMKSIFKKYLDFETKHGNEDTVASVKQKALEYVTAKTDVE